MGVRLGRGGGSGVLALGSSCKGGGGGGGGFVGISGE